MTTRKFGKKLLACLLAAVVVFSMFPNTAQAASSSEIRDQINEMEKENDALQDKIDGLKDDLNALKKQQQNNRNDIKLLIKEKEIIDQQIGLLFTQIVNMNEQIAAYNVMLADKQEELDEAEARLEKLNALYKERIRAMEEDGSISYWSVLFEANSFSDLLDRLNMVQEIAEADGRRLQQLRQAAQDVENAREMLVVQREELAKKKAVLTQTQEEFEVKSGEAKGLLQTLTAKMNDLKNQEADTKEVMEQLEKDLNELEIAIGKAEHEFDEAVYREYLATMTTATTAPTVKPGPNAGVGVGGSTEVDEDGLTWVVPCDYKRVSSAFGWRTHPIYGDRRFHNGVDLAAGCKMKKDGTTDSPIYATMSGVVVTATYNSSAGWYVTIDHLNGFRSTYMHMCCKPFVAVGDVVSAGQVIGCIGSTGASTGDHLHFGIYKNGDAVNPMKYIG